MLRHLRHASVHIVLLAYVAVALAPVALIVMNAFKSRKAIFRDPLALPDAESFSTEGFARVFENSDFAQFFANSLIVTLCTLFAVVLFGAMAAWALTAYRFRGRTFVGLFLALGIMVPIRLGTVAILDLMTTLGLTNTLTALILVYIAQGLPVAIFIFSEFIAQIPGDLADAARCDGAPEHRIFLHIILPLIKPTIATVAIFVMVPIWNDLWFPLILAPGDGKQTVTLGVQQFIGQYVTDWNAVLAALSLAILPILALYLVLSRQIVRGLTEGAIR
jgi:raffinose/stachyose/melibiose transport system permease protein